MSLLTRSFGILLLALSLTACAQSQDAASPEARQSRGGDRVERQLESLREAVGLSDEQAVQVRALLEAQAANRPQRGARGARGGGDREAMRAQRQAQQAEFHAELEAILSPDQIERFREWAAQQRQRGPRGGRRGNG